MSFAAALAALDATEVPVDAAGLASALLAHDRYTARLVAAIGVFDESEEWEADGCTSPIAWVRDLGRSHRDAAELVKLAAKLRHLPATLAAWIAGRLSYGQVQAIAAVVIERHVGLFAEHEAELVPAFDGLSVQDTTVAMRRWRERADACDDGRPPADDTSKAWLDSTLENRGALHASLDAEGFALAQAALELANSNDLDAPAPIRRGDALKDVFRFYLDNHNSGRTTRNHPHVVIHVRAETLGTDNVEAIFPATGMTVSQETIRRYLCDCDLHGMLEADGVIVKYGRAYRTPPPDMFAVLAARDVHCRWKGCDRPAAWCHAHHVKEWDRDFGPTDLDNLVLLCVRHHTHLHRKSWSAVLHPNGDFEVTPPRGAAWVTHAPARVQDRVPRPGTPPAAVHPLADHVDWIEARSVVRAWAQELVRQRTAA